MHFSIQQFSAFKTWRRFCFLIKHSVQVEKILTDLFWIRGAIKGFGGDRLDILRGGLNQHAYTDVGVLMACSIFASNWLPSIPCHGAMWDSLVLYYLSFLCVEKGRVREVGHLGY